MIAFAALVIAWIGVWFARPHLPLWQFLMLVAAVLWATDYTIGEFVNARMK